MANLLSTINKKYGSLNKKTIVQSLWKKTVDVGTAVVNILGATGIAGFKFHIPQTEMVKFASDITDQYTDINSPVQDHIALKPITITLSGLVGDYFYSINQIEDYLALVTPTLTIIKEFATEYSPIVQQIKSKYQNLKYPIQQLKLENNANTSFLVGTAEKSKIRFNTMDLFTLFQELYKVKSAQTRAFLFFEALWKSKLPFSVETTWKRYDNMVVLNIEPKRDNNADITEFTITFKQINTTQTKTETFAEYANRHAQQSADPINKGVEQGEKVSILDGVQYV